MTSPLTLPPVLAAREALQASAVAAARVGATLRSWASEAATRSWSAETTASRDCSCAAHSAASWETLATLKPRMYLSMMLDIDSASSFWKDPMLAPMCWWDARRRSSSARMDSSTAHIAAMRSCSRPTCVQSMSRSCSAASARASRAARSFSSRASLSRRALHCPFTFESSSRSFVTSSSRYPRFLPGCPPSTGDAEDPADADAVVVVDENDGDGSPDNCCCCCCCSERRPSEEVPLKGEIPPGRPFTPGRSPVDGSNIN